jgi:ATP-citrate lyase beta-subunit
MPLDAAIEVDSAAQFFVDNKWAETDIRKSAVEITSEEEAVEALNNESPASFSLRVLNPKGSIFMLLSGGGASVVIADEISQAGLHDVIANYGEYSGNPSEEETYLYATEVLKLLLASTASKKQLIIAGGVANFTDVAKTFAGITRAIGQQAKALKAQEVYILVRRGGPNQEMALKALDKFLTEIQLSHKVFGPEISLSKAVVYSVEHMQ